MADQSPGSALRRKPQLQPRRLTASIEGQPVGELAELAGVWRFTYAPEWLAWQGKFSISPALPLGDEPIIDGSSSRPVQWYFDNLLPEEAQRQLMAADANIKDPDAFGLLTYYGSESAGSLTLLPPETAVAPGDLRELPDAELSVRIRELPRHSLAAGAEKRMSLAGAQHKLAIVMKDGMLLQPVGSEPSTHILKPDHPGTDYPHSVANEWFVMTLAKRMGLQVPAVYRRYVPEPVFLIERFDRRPDAATRPRRIHAIDACQLLDLDRQFKYQQGSIETLVGVIDACRNKLQTRLRLFDWVVFNALTGNSDAHLKNLSFLVDPDGINLAPHYDLLCTVCYESKAYDRESWPSLSKLAWSINGATRFCELTFDNLVQAGGALGLNAKHAASQLERMRNSIMDEAKALLAEVDEENAEISARIDVGPTLAGETRCLRAIVYTVIQDMVELLKP